MQATRSQLDIDTHYQLTESQISFFRDRGYIKLKEVLSPEVLAYYGEEIEREVHQHNNNTLPMEERTTYQKAFIQIGNLWEKSEVIKTFVLGKRLGRIAAELLGTTGTRIYHDQALFKEASGGFTPWHADQFYWPLSTPLCVTAWIPLQDTPKEMGPLSFSAKSHRFEYGRDMKISDDSERLLQEALSAQKFEVVEEPFELSEVSFHYGWTYHRAGPNTTSDTRRVMTIIYMDEDMRLSEPKNPNQKNDWDHWCPGIKVGALVHSPKNPLVYSSKV